MARSASFRWAHLAATMALWFTACREGSSELSGVGLENTGLDGVMLFGSGELQVLERFEGSLGFDANGDGDAADTFPVVLDLADDSTTQLGLALDLGGFEVVIGGNLVALRVSEAAQGGQDLNADGDVSDAVLFVYDSATRVSTSTNLATGGFEAVMALGLVAFGVDEAAQGSTDLDGDGQQGSLVLHVYDSRTLTTLNAARALSSPLLAHEHEFAFTTTEVAAGDLNGDGDALDENIFQVFDGVLGGIVGPPVPVSGRMHALGERWFALVSESDQGQDLNGDSDLDDGVYHALDPHLPGAQSLGLSSLSLFSFADERFLVLPVQEIDGVDRNGDSDTEDRLWVVYDTTLEVARETGLAVGASFLTPAFTGNPVVIPIEELSAGEDLNADADLFDAVLHAVDPLTGQVTNLALETLNAPAGAGTKLFFPRFEGERGEDWNGDGDQEDLAFHVWNAATNASMDLGVSSARDLLPAVSPRRALLLVGELEEGRDLNGDLDLLDTVWFVHELESGTTLNLRRASFVALDESFALTPDGRGAVLVDEGGQGIDLNGDGDQDDAVLHRLR